MGMRRAFSILLLAFVASPALAGEQTPRAFVAWIYSHYQGSADAKAGAGVMLVTPAQIRRYFAPPLADQIIADRAAAAQRDEVPALDSDPFIDAQDWDIRHVAIQIESANDRTARASVRFENFGQAETVRLELVRTPAGWRVADVLWPGSEGWLSALYRK